MKTNGFQLQLVENDEIGILLSCSNFTDQVIWSKSVSDQSDPSRLSASVLYFASGKIQRFSNAHFMLQVSFEMQLFNLNDFANVSGYSQRWMLVLLWV